MALERARQSLKRMRSAVLQAAMTGRLVPHSDEDAASILDQISVERRSAWQAETNKPYREPAKPATFPLSVPKHWRIASLEAITERYAKPLIRKWLTCGDALQRSSSA